MQISYLNPRNFRFAALLALGLCLANVGWSTPLIQSVGVLPDPLVVGQSLTISVSASADVTQGTATVDFRPAAAAMLRVTLTKQGDVWTGSAIVPANLQVPSAFAAVVRILMFDASRHLVESDVNVVVNPPPITASFAGGVLTITGDNQDNIITASRDVTGNILVNGGAVVATSGAPTVANTSLIVIFGLGGNDTLTVDDANGPMPPSQLIGGPGTDTLIGSHSNDEFIWNPGDGSDVVEGGGGEDTLVFKGSNANENMSLSANGQRFRLFRDVGNVTMDCAGIQQVIVTALGGADNITVNDLTGTQVTNVIIDLAAIPGTTTGDGQADSVIIDGTAGADHITLTGSSNEVDVLGLAATVSVFGAEPDRDSLIVNALGGDDIVDASAVSAGLINLTLNGGAGNDTLIGSAGNDVMIGGPGSDIEFGGAGDDVFVWNPGDGSDTIEGQGGMDTMLFNGANVVENVVISANGQRLRFFRDVANITMDCAGIEIVQFAALGGADTITVNDLTGTDVAQVNLDLSATAGSGVGDGAVDTVIVNGTTGEDNVTINGSSAGVNVLGLSAGVSIFGADPTRDQLIVNLLDGDDTANAAGLQAGWINLTIDGGPGNDVLTGSPGADVLLGGEGDDVLIGGDGLDVLDGGPGNNVVIQ